MLLVDRNVDLRSIVSYFLVVESNAYHQEFGRVLILGVFLYVNYPISSFAGAGPPPVNGVVTSAFLRSAFLVISSISFI